MNNEHESLNNNNTLAGSFYAPEQKEQWDKENSGSGYYEVWGAQAYTYLVHHISKLVDNPSDPKTVLLIGEYADVQPFLERMVQREVIDCIESHQQDGKFMYFSHREFDFDNVAKSLHSEADAELFREFISTSVDKAYNPIAAVVNFDDGAVDGKPQYLDKILSVPQWKNGHLVKTIKPAVFNVANCEESSFRKDCGDVASVDWRKEVSTYVELPQDQPKMLIEHLIPEKALTVLAAPSYTGKTHIAIEMGLSLATGSDFLDHFKGPREPVPVTYHVPELHAALFRSFMQRLGAEERLQGCLENFHIRTLERDVWPLDSPQMIDSSRGRYVFLDTFGYFNDGDDSASYTQAINFAQKINNLIREGCLGVCGLYRGCPLIRRK